MQKADWIFADRLLQSIKAIGIILMTEASFMNFVDIEQRKNVVEQNLIEAELKLHAVLYELNIYSDSTKDADLEFDEDSRWYVRTVTILFQILGI